MRQARAQDYWDRAYRRSYGDNLTELDLNGLNRLHKIQITNGIVAICGVNGAGKSTIISAIKSLVGITLSQQDCYRIQERIVYGRALKNGMPIDCSNELGNMLSDKGWDVTKIRYVDCVASSNTQDFIISQANLDELLEQFEEYELQNDGVEMISYLVGKRYDSCKIWELEDVDANGVTMPYFQVSVDHVWYDSKSMGSGEHFLLFLFWCINNADKDTLVIIEEPETYISIVSQIHFSNYLGAQMAKKGIKIILTTHSPYILSKIKNENIRIVSRVGNNTSILTPDESLSAENVLGIRGGYSGTFFVEDQVAADFLSVILEDKAPSLLKTYTIDIAAGGETAISERLHFPKSEKIKYNFIGIYDGDMRDTLNTEGFVWKYCFLPGDKAIEEFFRDCLHEPDNVDKLCDFLGKEKDKTIAILATIDGEDCHDWFEELRKHLALEKRVLVSALYQVLMRDQTIVDSFITELQDCIAL